MSHKWHQLLQPLHPFTEYLILVVQILNALSHFTLSPAPATLTSRLNPSGAVVTDGISFATTATLMAAESFDRNRRLPVS